MHFAQVIPLTSFVMKKFKNNLAVRFNEHISSQITKYVHRFLLFLQDLEWPRPLLYKLLLNTSRVQYAHLQNASWRCVFWRLFQEKIVVQLANILRHIFLHKYLKLKHFYYINYIMDSYVEPLMWDYYAYVRRLINILRRFAQQIHFLLVLNDYWPFV